MAEVLFNYKGIETTTESNFNDKMKEILDKYISKQQINNKNIIFLYNGVKIKEGSRLIEQANEADFERRKLTIFVHEREENNNAGGKIIKSKDIICPECKENIFIDIKNFRINLNDCKNNHIRNNVQLEEYENTQIIDLSKIKCDKSKEKYY